MEIAGRRLKWRESSSSGLENLFERPRSTVLTSRIFYLFLLYTILIWNCEFLDLLCLFLKFPQASAVSRVVAVVLTALMGKLLIGRVRFYHTRLDLVFVVGSFILVAFFSVKSIRPDLSYDTHSYHLLCQIPGFIDNLNFHVMPGRFQMYGFRLGDRMFYPFRWLLGLRMGTMLNAGVMIIIYRQFTVIIDWFKHTCISSGRKCEGGQAANILLRFITNPSILAFFIVARFDILSQSGTYMVELLALPFFLEMLFLLLKETREKETAKEALLYCLLGGIFFCMKMTNIVYLAPMVLLYIWKIRKEITPVMILKCLLIGVVPVSIYLIYNELSTGNPIFPYYNTIFQSPYFGDADFKDARWGPRGFKEILLWPYYMFRYPEYRQSEIFITYKWDLVSGYLAMICILTAVLCKVNKRQPNVYKKELIVISIYVVSFFAWAVTTGYSRYFIGGFLLSGLLCVFLYMRMVTQMPRVYILPALLLMIPLTMETGYSFRAVYEGREAAMRDASPIHYANNIKWVFKDRDIFPQEVKDKVDVIFLTWGNYGSIARLIGEETPVYNMSAITEELSDYKDKYLGQIAEFMKEGKGVYDMLPQGKELLEEYIAWENKAGYYIEDLFFLENTLSGAQAFTMAKLNLADGRKNEYYSCKDIERKIVFEKVADIHTFSALVGEPNYWMAPIPFQITVIASDGTQEKQAAVIDMGEAEYKRVDFDMDLSGLNGEITLQFITSYEPMDAMIINPKITQK